MDDKINSEEKLMSLICHLSIVIPNIGIIAPIIIWVTQKEKSRFVKFNAIQAIFFQLVFFALLILSIFTGIILMFVSLPLIMASSSTEPGTLFFVSIACIYLFIPLWFIFAIFAITAAVKSFKGKIFRYLIIGRIVQKRVYR